MIGLNNAKKGKCLAAFLCFLLLLGYVFSHLTYLFRNSDDGRLNFLTFAEEPEESLDVVYIGGSNVYVFWNPMLAWERHGFTSYNYSTSNMPVVTFLPAIKKLQKRKSPKLFVVGIRTFLSPIYESLAAEGIINGGGYRNVVDSQDLSASRANTVSYCCDINPDSSKDALSSYFDLIYYHTNLTSLANPRNWNMMNNTTGNITGELDSSYFKGYMANSYLTAQVAMYQGFQPPVTEERALLNAESEKCYRELLAYCSDNEIPLLITANPNISTEELEKEINTCKDIAAEYGIPFLNINTSECWKKMKLDPETDFYNGNHLNVLGAEKFTGFLADYLAQNYTLPDHRDAPKYDSWQHMYEENYLPTIEPLQEQTRNTIAEYKETIKCEGKMRRTENASEWFSYADDPNITLLIAANDRISGTPSVETSFILDKFGIMPFIENEGDTFIGVYSGSVMVSDTEATTYEGATTTPKHKSSYKSINYDIQLLASKMDVQVGADNYVYKKGNGIKILVIDNNLLRVADCISLNVDHEGNLTLDHLQVME